MKIKYVEQMNIKDVAFSEIFALSRIRQISRKIATRGANEQLKQGRLFFHILLYVKKLKL